MTFRIAGTLVILPLAVAGVIAASSGLPSAPLSSLQIYFIDVEGGQSTLFVTPDKHSLLIDTGWPDAESRDAQRIASAAKAAGIERIDDVLLTHYHVDHTGGVPQLVAKIPVGTFIDHGPNREVTDGSTVQAAEAYQRVLATQHYGHLVPKPRDVLPIQGMKITVVSADGSLIAQPLPGGGGANQYCAFSEKRPADQTENARSLGVLINYGKLRILDLGDLTRDKEMELMCPVNKLGHIDLLVVSHHGWNQSSSPALVDAIAPRVAIMDNSAKKGGSPSVWDTVEKAPGLEDLWQLHYSEEGGPTHNVEAARIANLQGPDTGNYLKVAAYPSGRLEVFNARTGTTKQYPPK
ncbi:MAG: MBL fold metallo-hydrolase [Silvibacterium sp.]